MMEGHVQLTRNPHLVLKTSTAKGRGVFTTQDIAAGSVVEACPVLIFPTAQVQHTGQTLLQHYTYNWPISDNESGRIITTQALVLGLGSMFNHSTAKQNVGWERSIERQIMTYRALRNISAGEELCINYGRLWFADADAHEEEESEQAANGDRELMALAQIGVDE